MCSINPSLVEEETAVYYRDVAIILDGVNNIRLREYRVYIWYSNLVKYTNVHDNSFFLNAVHLFPNNEAWVAKEYRLNKLFKATLLLKLIELLIDNFAVSRTQWIHLNISRLVDVLPIVY